MREPRTTPAAVVAALIATMVILVSCGRSQPAAAPPLELPETHIPEADTSDTAADAADEVTAIAEPPELIPPAMWERTLAEITPDGDVPLEVALDAFQLAVAPIPGSSIEPNEHDVELPDASGALHWVLRHWDELDAEQRAVVSAALSPEGDVAADPAAAPATEAPTTTVVEATPAAVSSAAATLSPAVQRSTSVRSTPAAAGQSTPASNVGCYGQRVMTADSPGAEPYRAQLDELEIDIEAQLSGEIQMIAPVYLQLDSRELGLGRAYTWGDPGDCSQNGLATCTIHLSPRAQNAAPAEQRAILAHELMHCFVFQYLGMTTYDLPPWVGEGIPAWVGEDLGGGTSLSESWWRDYLTQPQRSLYSRAYDAIGFYAHLDEVGTDPWTTIVDTLDGYENEPAFAGAGAESRGFLDSWPSGTLRDAERGADWDTDGPGITDDHAAPLAVSVADGSAASRDIDVVSGALFSIAGSADVVRIDVEGYARLSDTEGTDTVLEGSSTFCLRPGGCECPGGGGDTDAEPLGDDAVLAITGGTDAGSVTFTGASVECDEEPGDAEAPGDELDECLVGTWVSYAVAMQDTTTAMPATSLGGGEHITLEIRSDGSFTMDFDGSTPVLSDVGGFQMGHQTRGVAHGRLEASGGRLTVTEQDYADSLHTKFVGASGGGPEQQGGIGINTGTYECTSNSLDTEEPTELGRNVFLFEST
jgi:hypothetical protein